MSDFSELDAELEAFGALFDNEKDLGSLLVNNTVTARNDLGRFAEHVHEAHARATATAGRRGADMMRTIIPKKTGALAGTVSWSLEGSRHGAITWGNADTPYWRYVAFGARPHPITGWVNFYWERMERDWEPGPNTIKHPGIHPNPFITTTYRHTQMELEEAMRREYAQL
jgi:HK97 gp10 family phage protein